MLSLLLKLPGEEASAHHYSSSPIEECDVILRGFQGKAQGYVINRPLETADFWELFGQDALEA